jgi:oxygen-dependent protoporphyrinogen oxidase
VTGGVTNRPERSHALVIGAGIAGLTVARDLAQAGWTVTVLEGDSEPGGCVRAHTVAGLRLDRGAESFALARAAARDLIDELGLPVVAPNPAGAWVRHEAGQAPLPRAGLLGIPADVSAADVRAVIGRLGVARARVDAMAPVRWGWSDGLGPVVRRRMGSRVLRRLVDPVAGGVYSADPDGLDMDSVAPGLRQAALAAGSLSGGVAELRGAAAGPPGATVAGIDGGMARLTDALLREVRAAGGEVLCGTTVTDLRRSEDGWTVTSTDRAGARSVTVPTVVLAVPPSTADTLLRPASDDVLTHPAARRSAAVSLATLVVRSRALSAAPRGSGVLVASRARGVRAKALTHATAKWGWLAEAAGPDVHVVRLSYGRGSSIGVHRPSRDQYADEIDLPATALADASELLGVSLTESNLIDSAVVRYQDTVPVFSTGQAQAVARFRTLLAGFPGMAVVGSGVAGTGLAAVIGDARAAAGALLAGTAAG